MFSVMDTPSKNGSYLVIAACLLAVISLILGIIALRSLSAMKKDMGDVGGLAARLDSIETSSRKAAGDAERAVSRLATISSDTQRAFDNVSKELATLRTNVNRSTIETKELGERVTALHGRPSTSPSTSTTATAAAPASATAPAQTAPAAGASASPAQGNLGADGTYTIKAGDTFARLSGLFGVPVQAIEQANPGVDPRRLRIGQKIVIPSDS